MAADIISKDWVVLGRILLSLAAHPLLFIALLCTVSAFALGVINESVVVADCLIVLIRHLKREAKRLVKAWRRIKDELTTWNSGD